MLCICEVYAGNKLLLQEILESLNRGKRQMYLVVLGLDCFKRFLTFKLFFNFERIAY